MKRPVVVVPYDPTWPSAFESLRKPVSEALQGLATAIEHVGSTAVPGLAAKPTIDIDVVIPTRADLGAAIARLRPLGYEHQGDLGVPGREAFRHGSPIVHNLYVCAADSVELARHLRFRDHLRAHPHDAAAYAELKRRLAALHAGDRDAYTLAKTDFIERILALP